MLKKFLRKYKKIKIKRIIKKFKKYPIEMLTDIDQYIHRRNGVIEFPKFKVTETFRIFTTYEGTEIYQIFQKYGRQKDLKKKLNFPIYWDLETGEHKLYLGD